MQLYAICMLLRGGACYCRLSYAMVCCCVTTAARWRKVVQFSWLQEKIKPRRRARAASRERWMAARSTR
eukprot:8970105-Pyramimonas_sp.AAC.1